MTQEVQAPVEATESTPEATPKVTPDATTELTPTGEAVVADETTDATAEGTTEALSAEPELFDPSQYDADDSPHHESFQKFKQEEQARGWAQARESFSGQFEALEKRDTDLKDLRARALNSYNTLKGRLDAALEKGQVDRDGFKEVFQDPNFARSMAEMGQDLQREAHEKGVQSGRELGGASLLEAVVSIGAKTLGRQALAQEFIPNIKSARTQEDAVALIEGFVKKVKDIGYQLGLTDGKSGATHADDIATRKTEKPAQSVGSTAGGRTDKEILLDPTTPVSQLQEIRDRQRAG